VEEVAVGRARLKDAVGFLDPVLALCSLLALPAVYFAARLRQRTPLTRGLFDRIGVSLVPHHYYEPPVLSKDLYRPLDEPRYLPGIDLNVSGQLAFLGSLRYGGEIESLGNRSFVGRAVNVNSPSYGMGDSELLYSVLRKAKPRRIVEIGSGQSTLIALAAREANRQEDPSYDCTITCIEPFEQPWLESTGVSVLRDRVELVDRAVFGTLGAGDVLFVDSSHVIRPQGDVVTEYLELIPALADGVLVHVHDVRIPRDYSDDWIVRVRRLWNEQYLLEALLSENPRIQIVAAANMLSKDYPDEFGAAFPVWGRSRNREPSSFWMRRVPRERAANGTGA
jgi:hypothetical protein